MKAMRIPRTCWLSVLVLVGLFAPSAFAADIVVPAHVADEIVAVGSQSSSIPSLTKPDDALVLAAAYEAFRWNPRLTKEEFTQQILDAKHEFYSEWTPTAPGQPPGLGGGTLHSWVSGLGGILATKIHPAFAFLDATWQSGEAIYASTHRHEAAVSSLLQQYYTQQASYEYWTHIADMVGNKAVEMPELREALADPRVLGYVPEGPWYRQLESSPLPAMRDLATHRDAANNLVISPEQLKSGQRQLFPGGDVNYFSPWSRTHCFPSECSVQ